MPSSYKHIDTNLSRVNADEFTMSTNLSREQKPEPQDYYMYLLRAEQGRDKDTRRTSLLTQKPANQKDTTTIEPLSYDKLWEGDFLTTFKASPAPIVIFQVIPIPENSPFRETKLVLGFNFATNELLGYTLDPTKVPIKEIYSQPDIWRECRDPSALSKSWPRRKNVISISTSRFYEMLDFTMQYSSEIGADMLRDGILRFFKEVSVPLHPSLDLVVVIQFAQFLADFVHVLEDDWGRARALVERYEAYQDVLRDVLLRASVDVWMTSYEVLKVGMGGRKKDVVPDEERDRIRLLIDEKAGGKVDKKRDGSENQSRNYRQPYVQDADDGGQHMAMQFLQQGVQGTLSGIQPTSVGDGGGRGQQDGKMGSGPQHGVYETSYEWHWYTWIILAVIFMVCAWLFDNEMYSHGVAFMAGFFVLCFVVTPGGEDSSSLLTPLADALRLPIIHSYLVAMLARWDLWVIDVLAALAAFELLVHGQRELLAEEALGWVTIRTVILICQWKGVNIDFLLRPGWMGRGWRWVIDSIPDWIFDSNVQWSMWYILALDCTAVISNAYFLLAKDYTPLARSVIVWYVLRYWFSSFEEWRNWMRELLLPYLAKYFSILYLPYGIVFLVIIAHQQWKLLFAGISLGIVVHWAASRIWKLAMNGYEAKTFLIWTFVAWRTFRAGNYVLELEADYFVLAVFARWMSRVGVKEGYNFVFFWFAMVLVWRVHVTKIESMVVPVDILVIFCLDWLSVAVMESAVPAVSTQSKPTPWNEHLWDIYSTPTLRRVSSWGEEIAD